MFSARFVSKFNAAAKALSIGIAVLFGANLSVTAQDANALFDQGVAQYADMENWERSEQAAASFTAACKAGLAKACYYGGVVIYNNFDRDGSIPMLKTACDGGEMRACYMVADMLRYGVGMEQDEAAAQALYGKACAQGQMPACLRYGDMLEYGQGGEENPRKAYVVFKKSCDAGVSTACYKIASFLRYSEVVPNDETAARAALESACKQNNWSACSELAGMLQNGSGGPFDLPRARDIYSRVCLDSDDQSACDNMLRILLP